MNNPAEGHLGTATNPINQNQKWTAKKSYPLSAILEPQSLRVDHVSELSTRMQAFSCFTCRPCGVYFGSCSQRLRIRVRFSTYCNNILGICGFRSDQRIVCGIAQDQRAALVVSATDSTCLLDDLAVPSDNILHRPRRHIMELHKR